jgi:hypothetical protein
MALLSQTRMGRVAGTRASRTTCVRVQAVQERKGSSGKPSMAGTTAAPDRSVGASKQLSTYDCCMLSIVLRVFE